MPTLHIEPDLPPVPPELSLTGWRREFCVELRGNGDARIFVRAVDTASLKADELRRAVLFQRLEPRFTDLEGCVQALRTDLERLADSAQRVQPSKDNLFSAVTFDKAAWERVQKGLDRWTRRPVRASAP